MGKTSDRRGALVASTSAYERSLSSQGPVVPSALRAKHERMAESPFSFFRATFYRFAELFHAQSAAVASAPSLVAVGDLHVENFGTWRDSEGRLTWGVNDFDEAYPAPYTLDLVRLATSVKLAAEESHLQISLSDGCEALLHGYRAALMAGGEPIVLADRHPWLRDIAISSARDPSRFWAKMKSLPRFRGALPRKVASALEATFPVAGLGYERRTRVAGLGSLGRVRMVALAKFEGAYAAREAKALSLSALAKGRAPRRGNFYAYLLTRSVRARDPFVRVEGSWLLRRLAPDCARVELADLPRTRDEARLLTNMGWETGNVHLGTAGAAATILRHLNRLPGGWLKKSAKNLSDEVVADAEAWRSHLGRGRRARGEA